MKPIAANYKIYFSETKYLWSLLAALGLFGLSLFINYFAVIYAGERASNAVTDIILSNFPVIDVSQIFIFGPFFLWTFVGILIFIEPKRIPFVLKSIALFIIIRSIFISLTHIGPFLDHTNFNGAPNFFQLLTSGGDLFFSAHTGLPFLMALIFCKDKRLLVFFTLVAIFFGIVVLVGHYHYSIDVLSAFFITYTIFHIAKYLFRKDWRLFEGGFLINPPYSDLI